MSNVTDYLKQAEKWADKVVGDNPGPGFGAVFAALAQAYATMALAAATRDQP